MAIFGISEEQVRGSAMNDIYTVWLRQNGELRPAVAFTTHNAARAFVAEKTGLPVEKIGRNLRANPRSFRIRRFTLDPAVVGWVVCSHDPLVDFGHYLEWFDSYVDASQLADLYPEGYVRPESYSEALVRLSL